MAGPFEFELGQERGDLPRVVPKDTMIERWHPEAEAVIAAELNRCVLGETDHIELNMTLAQQMERLRASIDRFKITLIDAFTPALTKAVTALAKFAQAFERKDQ